ncbi:MAG TPA: tyrosine-type recombinase/integrase [Haliscomenobacter sp.]|uniref:tyrosine-type recombinase/integrase n=1 Tax=Haliscomenobacter sp. TaxID=2717303 RepID=UPI002C566323|nr:tyrosine-type recombinase/integrase [Haliscomenobacter sp.]HOY18608.1 tyrosine-type recombinase/integrase [Haliscomenobacter sp.]
MTIQKFLRYLQFEKRFSVHTIEAYQADLVQFSTYLQSQYEIAEPSAIQHIHIRSWAVSLMEQKNAATTIRRKLSTLKSYFRYLQREKIISRSPMLQVSLPKLGKRLPVVVPEKSLAKLLDPVETPTDYTGLRDQVVIELLYLTGMRRAELLSLKVSDLNLHTHTIKVLGKGNKERLIPMGHATAGLLKLYLETRRETFPDSIQTALFLTDRGEPAYPKLIYRIVNGYLSTVTTQEKRSPHVLRHSFATHLSDHGANLNAIKELLGHSSLAATQIYTHHSIERLKKIYQQAHPKSGAD